MSRNRGPGQSMTAGATGIPIGATEVDAAPFEGGRGTAGLGLVTEMKRLPRYTGVATLCFLPLHLGAFPIRERAFFLAASGAVGLAAP